MLRVLTLSTLFPNSAQPVLGCFVERQTLGLAALPEVELKVVAPVGLPPGLLARHPHYAARAALPERENWKGLDVLRPQFPVLPVIGQSLAARSMARALLPLLLRLRATFPLDIIDAEFFWPDGPAAAWLGRKLGVPVSIKARGSDINYWARSGTISRQIRRAGRQADGLLAVSEALKAQMQRIGMPAGIRVHYTGVDRSRFKPSDKTSAKEALGVTGPLIVTAGALIRRKGQWLAIEALGRIPGAMLALVGEGPDRTKLERQAKSLGLENRILFLGSLPQEEVARWMAAADVMLLPCESEGLANVWVEALASGTPVVTSDIGGAHEAIAPGAGRLVPLDAQPIADAVAELLANPPAQDRLLASVARFDWDRNRDELYEHLRGLVRR